MAAAETAAIERAHERPSSVGPKRMREWEDEPSPVKKTASDENRARMDDMHHRRPSTPPREFLRRSSSEARRAEDQRRANENYHPSEAAHHPHTHSLPAHLPPMQSAPGAVHEQPQSLPPAPKDYPMEDRDRERKGLEHQVPPPPPPPMNEPERAARKMEVDEDYDDEGDDEKKGTGSGPTSGPAIDGKRTPPTNGHANGLGMSGQTQSKVEASA